MHKKVFCSTLLFLFATLMVADTRYSIRSIYGYATIKDLGEVLLGDINPTHKEYKIYSIDGGYLLWGNING